MRLLLCALLVCLLSSTVVSGEEIDTNWIHISTEQGSREINENDYGAIFLKVNTANSSTEASKTAKFFKGIAKAIGKFLAPDTKAFVLTATFVVNNQEPVTVPFFASSYNEDKDDWTYVKYDDQLITQYYRLNTDYDKVKVTVKASYSNEMNSKIGDAITKISGFITALQPQKAIVDILTSKAVGNAAVEVDSIINNAFSSKRDITKVMQFSAFKGDKLLIKLSLPEQGTILNMFTITTRPTLFSLSDSVKYSVNTDATTLLSKKYTQTGDTIIDYIYGNASLKDKFEDESDIVESVNKFCIDLSDNLQKDLGLNKLDRAIVLWAILQRHSWWSHSSARRPVSEDLDMCEVLIIEDLKQTNLNIPPLIRQPGRDAQIADREKVLFKLARALKNNNKQQISNLLENNIVVYDNTGSDELLDIYNYDDAPDFTAAKFADIISKVKFTIFGDNRYDKKNVNLVDIKNVSIGSNLKKVTATIVFNPKTLKIMTITFNAIAS